MGYAYKADQEILLGFAMLLRVFHHFCCSSEEFVKCVPMHLFRKKAYLSNLYVDGISLFRKKEYEQRLRNSKNILFDMIYLDANVQSIEILDVLPQIILQ